MYTAIAIFSFITILFIAREETFAEALGYDEENAAAFPIRICRAAIAGIPLIGIIKPGTIPPAPALAALGLFILIVFASAVHETHRITDFGYSGYVAAETYDEESCPNPEKLGLPLFCFEQPLERYLEEHGWARKESK